MIPILGTFLTLFVGGHPVHFWVINSYNWQLFGNYHSEITQIHEIIKFELLTRLSSSGCHSQTGLGGQDVPPRQDLYIFAISCAACTRKDGMNYPSIMVNVHSFM